eukprot:scaffold73098_cov45-Phaeocystis_antarctica.AAC.2
MSPRLQPYVSQAATVCAPGCNRMCPRLPPYVPQAATVCVTGCNRMCHRLQPYVSQVTASVAWERRAAAEAELGI